MIIFFWPTTGVFIPIDSNLHWLPRLDHTNIYPRLVGGDYKGINIDVDVIGSGLLDIVLKSSTLESRLVDAYSLQQNSSFHYCWNGRLQAGQETPEGAYTLQFFFDKQLAREIAINVLPAPVLYLSGQDGEVLSPDRPEVKYSCQVSGRGVLTVSISPLAAQGVDVLNSKNIIYESAVVDGINFYTLRSAVRGVPLADGCYYVHFILCPRELRQYNILNSLRSLMFIVNNHALSIGCITLDKTAINPCMPAPETITASFSISEDAVLSVDIPDADHNPVITLRDHTYFQAGVIDITWDGSFAPDNTYKVVIRAADLYGNTAAKELSVIVDNNRQEVSHQNTYFLHSENIKVNKQTTNLQGQPQIAAIDDGIVITWNGTNLTATCMVFMHN